MTDQSAVASCRIEGPVAATSLHEVDAVDFDLADAAGRSLVAAQVKSSGQGRALSAPRALEVLVQLVSGLASQRYELITNARPDERCARLADMLATLNGDPVGLRQALEDFFSAAPASLRRFATLTPERWQRLATARIVFDTRDEDGLRVDLHNRLCALRHGSERGMSVRSAGLVLGFLVAEVLRRAANPPSSGWDLEDFRACVRVDDDVLVTALGRQDFGVVAGPLPPVPDISRPHLMEQVAAVLHPAAPATGVAVCVLSGLSGIGKSSVAAGYVAAQAYRYDMVFWMDASTPQTLAGAFARLLAHLGAPNDAAQDPALVRERVHVLLQRTPGPWLLVFDDASPGMLQEWLPPLGRGQVLVTSISRRWRGALGLVEVDALDPPQALGLLRLRLGLRDDQDTDHEEALTGLVEALGRWPLAIELAAGYLVDSRLSPERVGEYQSRLLSVALDDETVLPPGYPRTLVAAVTLSLERLYESARRSPEILVGCQGLLLSFCCFAAQRIPVHLAFVSTIVPDTELPNTRVQLMLDEAASPLRDILRELFALSFVRPDTLLPSNELRDAVPGGDETVSMNTVLQFVLNRLLSQCPNKIQILQWACAHTNAWLAQAVDDGQSDRAWDLAQHAAALADQVQNSDIATLHTALLLGNLAAFQSDHGRYDLARRLLECELEWFASGRVHADRVAAQARLQLASLVDLTAPADGDEQTVLLLVPVLDHLAALPAADRRNYADVITQALILLQRASRRTSRSIVIDQLLARFQELADPLPDTPTIRAMQQLVSLGALMEEGRASDAEQAAIRALDLIGSLWTSQAAEARRLLIEALALQHKWEQADAEYTRFRRYLGSRTLHRLTVNYLVHNLGQCTAMMWVLTGNDAALALLDRLVEDTGSYHDHLAENDYDRTRFQLLRAVHAAAHEVVKLDEPTIPGAARPAEFVTLLSQIATLPFADAPLRAHAWEVIFGGLHTRLTVRFGEAMHGRIHSHESAALAELPPSMAAQLDVALRETPTLGYLGLSTDPAFAALGFRSNIDLLDPNIPGLSGPLPLVLLEPETRHLVRAADGTMVDAQLHWFCAHGLRRLWGFQAVPSSADLTLRPGGTSLLLLDSKEGVVTRIYARPNLAWQKAVQRRGRALVIACYAFALGEPLRSQTILSSPVSTARCFQEALAEGTLAASIASWRDPRPPSARKRPRTGRKRRSR
ncbi:ATP-binding protein [Embleya sp. NPDC005971]|uniref:ATP-binding protein n=1 Tax=Embleya sp. NPDC005971 TaxID=3156724 RepID=UPI0033C07D4A